MNNWTLYGIRVLVSKNQLLILMMNEKVNRVVEHDRIFFL